MPSLLQIVSLANGSPTRYDGRYLVEFDPESDGDYYQFGTGFPMKLETTSDPREAKQFQSATDAHHLWALACKRDPIRWDGKPNKPLTAFTCVIVPYESQIQILEKQNAR